MKNDSEILLSKSLFLGAGGEREVYVHPKDPTKVIKIIKLNSDIFKLPTKEAMRRNNNDTDWYYYGLIKNKLEDFNHITKLFGWVQTNMGRGLVSERIVNYDGSEPITFQDAIISQILSTELEVKLIKQLTEYLLNNKIIFADAYLTNVLLHKESKNDYKLVIIDGLGLRKRDLKSWMHLNIEIINKIRINQQIDKVKNHYLNLKPLDAAVELKFNFETKS